MMLGAEEALKRDKESKERPALPVDSVSEARTVKPDRTRNRAAPESDQQALCRRMSEFELASPQPGTVAGESSPAEPLRSSPAHPGRSPSPRLDTAATKFRADQIDALPPEARTPKKSSSTAPPTYLTRRIVDLEPLPRFSDVSEQQWSRLFSKKIAQCEIVFDFSMPLFDIQNKEIKTSALNDILVMVTERTAAFAEAQYQEVICMFARNIFRAIPPSPNPVGEEFDPEDDEPLYDPSWPHMHLVYEILIHLVESPAFNVNIARKCIDQLFVYRLMTLFDVEDPRERDMVKTAVHRIYGKFLNLRAFIRKAMRHIFYEFIYEEERHQVAEMLEILGSVVNGFAVPLREEHKVFLEKTLLPLHKNRCLPLYYSQLSLCVVQYAEKDSLLVEKIILGLLRLWPKTNTSKEIMFLNEIEEVLDVTPADCFSSFLIPLFHQLARCIASSHFQVAERALAFWNNEYLISVIGEHISEVMPIVLPGMLRYPRVHWNKSVQLQVFNGLRVFMELDPRLYESISSEQTKFLLTQKPETGERWALIEALARRNSESQEGKHTDLSPSLAPGLQHSTERPASAS